MLNSTKNSYLRNLLLIIVFLFFIVLAIWWFVLKPFNYNPDLEHAKYIWGSIYQIIAIIGAVSGIVISFGQTFYSYFNLYAQIQAPYPSIGDIGYFGSVIAYIFGVLCLAKVSGAKVSLQLLRNKMQAFLLPSIMLIISYIIFLRNYEFDWTNKIKIFLDFGYPLGQAIYVSLAVLTLILTAKVLGGIMKKPVILFLVALIMQYVSDFNFLFQANNGSWYVGGIGDFLYMLSYLLMTLSIIQIGYSLRSLKESN